MTAPPPVLPGGLTTHLHWWCRRCGRWEIVDDRDICTECAYHLHGRLTATMSVVLRRAVRAVRRRPR